MHSLQKQLECYSEYLSFTIFSLLTVVICILILLISWFLGGRSYSRYKNTPFESGIESYGNTHLRFSVHFYLIGIFFLVFDVESMYLYVWAISINETGWVGFSEAFVFVFVLLVGLIYIVRTGSFNWSEKISYVNKKTNIKKNVIKLPFP